MAAVSLWNRGVGIPAFTKVARPISTNYKVDSLGNSLFKQPAYTDFMKRNSFFANGLQPSRASRIYAPSPPLRPARYLDLPAGAYIESKPDHLSTHSLLKEADFLNFSYKREASLPSHVLSSINGEIRKNRGVVNLDKLLQNGRKWDSVLAALYEMPDEIEAILLPEASSPELIREIFNFLSSIDRKRVASIDLNPWKDPDVFITYDFMEQNITLEQLEEIRQKIQDGDRIHFKNVPLVEAYLKIFSDLFLNPPGKFDKVLETGRSHKLL